MPDEMKGVMTCPECTQHRERSFAWESKFWRLSSLLVECIGPRAHQQLPGLEQTWAQAFRTLTGVEFADAQARAIALAMLQRDKARKAKAS